MDSDLTCTYYHFIHPHCYTTNMAKISNFHMNIVAYNCGIDNFNNIPTITTNEYIFE